jgi:hypothetical protein
MEVQKQVGAASLQLTATMKILSRACGIERVSIARALQDAILHGDGAQFGGSYTQEGPPGLSRFIVQDSKGLAVVFRRQ